jgi:hypothetical protein
MITVAALIAVACLLLIVAGVRSRRPRPRRGISIGTISERHAARRRILKGS